jgi:exonuclease SbcC
MWKLKEVNAINLCSFKELNYELAQGKTTLVFGNNMDNDSQASNGSGKSALIEALAIGLTGETLRKVKMDEAINDAADEAIIRLLFANEMEKRTLMVNRTLRRKSPQEVSVSLSEDGGECQPIAQPSVTEYNKFILETIGLSKGDIHSNFILSKHKYAPFLSSSDRDKKELINRFSNGTMVDESIAALQADMEPIQRRLLEAEANLATCKGRVSAIEEQIANAMAESEERSLKKKERVAKWEEAIAGKRAFIRERKTDIGHINDTLDKYEELEQELQGLEDGDKDLKTICESINDKLRAVGLPSVKDYAGMSMKNLAELDGLKARCQTIQEEIGSYTKELESAKERHARLISRYEEAQKNHAMESEKIQQEVDRLLSSINGLETENRALQMKRMKLDNSIAALQKQLAGAITCPKCRHEFALQGGTDMEKTRLRLREEQAQADGVERDLIKGREEIEGRTKQGQAARAEQRRLAGEQSKWSAKLTTSQTEVDKMTRTSSSLESKLEETKAKVGILQKNIGTYRRELFDDAFGTIDHSFKKQEGAIKLAKEEIRNAEGSIQSYEESIKDAENSSDTDVIASLNVSKEKYAKGLERALSIHEEAQKGLARLKAQEIVFVEFKTYLANTKIEALAHVTNEFLEAIGSDIRIVFSGFTVLKSGKVRDKIAISLVRDGVDCGSFDKFSEGEKARVNLANILAMRKLTNVSCPDGKGLDLLVLDEILEATDESGLANIFEALNALQITSLVVSHGNIAENYPHRLVVNKKNNVSSINEPA